MDQLLSYLFAARNRAHKLHLSTRSFAQHVALGELYDGLNELIDELAEVYQGSSMVPSVIDDSGAFTATLGTDPVGFAFRLYDQIKELRNTQNFPQETHLLNIVDEITAVVARAKYKLSRLQ